MMDNLTRNFDKRPMMSIGQQGKFSSIEQLASIESQDDDQYHNYVIGKIIQYISYGFR